MILDRKKLIISVAAVGVLLLLMALSASPALAQTLSVDKSGPDTVTVESDDTEDSNTDDQYTPNVEITNITNIPETALPKTGGPPLLGILFSVVAGAGLLTAVVGRRR